MHDTVVIDASCREIATMVIAGAAVAELDHEPAPTTSTEVELYVDRQAVAVIAPVMKATVGALKAAVARAKPHIPKGGSLYQLQYVRFTSGPGETIVVTATDLLTATRFTIDGVGLPKFDVLLRHEDLKGFLDGFDKKEQDVEVRMEQQLDGRVRLETAVTTAEMCGKETDEFPRLPAFVEYDREGRPFGWPVDIDAMAEVAVAASSDDNRPIITGVLMEGDCVVGTDSYRLFFVEGVPSWPCDSIIVPAVAVRLAHKQGAGGVYLADQGRTLIFICPDGGLISTRLIEGGFPNWRGLVPTAYPNILRIDDHAAIGAAVKRLKYLLKDAIPVRLGYQDGDLAFMAARQDRGNQHAKIGDGVVPIEGHRMDQDEGWVTIGAFNPFYLMACFVGLDSDAVTFEGIDALKPWIIRAPKANGTTACRLLMPVRVS